MKCPMNNVFLILLTIFVLCASADAADKIKVAYPVPAGQFITFPLAQKRGFFKEEGLDAEVIRIRAVTSRVALDHGEIDYYTSIGDSVSAAIGGLQIKIVACYVPAPPFVLIARPEFKSVKELQGKTIGVSTFGNTPHVIARTVVRHFGLDPEQDIKFVNTGSFEARLAALQQGLTAATVVPVPGRFSGNEDGLYYSSEVP